MNMKSIRLAGQLIICSTLPGTTLAIDVRNNQRAEAEYLAIEISGTLRAPTALADQIQLDLAAIRVEYPQVANIRVLPSWEAGDVLVELTRDSFDSLKAGIYTGFDSLFAQLGTPAIRLGADHPHLTPSAYLAFSDVYSGPVLANLFDSAPGVVRALPNGTIGDGDDIIARADRTYTLSHGDGDCPAGCLFRESWTFVATGAAGGVKVAPVPEPSALAHLCGVLFAAAMFPNCRLRQDA